MSDEQNKKIIDDLIEKASKNLDQTNSIDSLRERMNFLESLVISNLLVKVAAMEAILVDSKLIDKDVYAGKVNDMSDRLTQMLDDLQKKISTAEEALKKKDNN